MSSERAFGVSEQPEETCPMIDAVLKGIADAISSAKASDGDDVNELKDALSDVDWAISGIPSDLENIRRHITDIRSWGQEWKDQAKELKDRISELERTVNIAYAVHKKKSGAHQRA